MCCEAASDPDFFHGSGEIIVVPVLVRVAEHEIKRPGECGNDFMSVPEPGIDKFLQARRAKIGNGFIMALFIDLNRYQLPAGFR